MDLKSTNLKAKISSQSQTLRSNLSDIREVESLRENLIRTYQNNNTAGIVSRSMLDQSLHLFSVKLNNLYTFRVELKQQLHALNQDLRASKVSEYKASEKEKQAIESQVRAALTGIDYQLVRSHGEIVIKIKL